MADNNQAAGAAVSAGQGWTDRELLVYLYALVKQSGVKLDFNNTPLPNGRIRKSGEFAIRRLEYRLRDDLAALNN